MKRVLVAEDESAIREFIIINLRRNGYEVVEAADGAQAVDLANTMNAAAILTSRFST